MTDDLTMTAHEHRSRKMLIGAVALMALVIALVAVLGSGASDPPAPTVDRAQVAADATPEEALDAAFVALGDTFTYRLDVTLDQVLAIEVIGLQVGDRSTFVARQDEVEAHVLIAPEGQWVRASADEPWDLADETDAAAEAFDLERAVAGVTEVRRNAAGDLDVRFAAEALGDDAPAVDAVIVLRDDRTMIMTYELTADGQGVAVVAELAPAHDATIHLP